MDQACLDLLYAADGNASFVERVESRQGVNTLGHAEADRSGSRAYRLVSLDS